jgi:hypothetical protein
MVNTKKCQIINCGNKARITRFGIPAELRHLCHQLAKGKKSTTHLHINLAYIPANKAGTSITELEMMESHAANSATFLRSRSK